MPYRNRYPLHVVVIDNKGELWVCLPHNHGWVSASEFMANLPANCDAADSVPDYVPMNLHMMTTLEMADYLQ